jgi:ubiquinone/menaquinone biosynthesis C-methylase UbiE
VDLSAEILRKARKKAAKEGYNADFVRSDIEQLPFSPEVFDIAICVDTFVHLPNQKRALNELASATKKGGKMAINMTNRNPFWVITVHGLTNLRRFFKDLCLYYFPEPVINPLTKLLRRPPFGKHLSRKEFKILFGKNLKLEAFKEYGLEPPVFFLAIAKKPLTRISSRQGCRIEENRAEL